MEVHDRDNLTYTEVHQRERTLIDSYAEEEEDEDVIDDLIVKHGGCGLFQVFSFAAVAWGMAAQSWFFYGLGFYT